MTHKDYLRAQLASACAPLSRQSTYDWAASNITLPMGPFAVNGAFDPNRSRWLNPVFDALDDSRTRKVDVAAPVRGCKTLIGDLWFPKVTVTDPGGFMWTTAEDGLAKTQIARTMAVLRACDATRGLLPDRFDTMGWTFRNGCPFECQGTAKSNLQAKGRRYVLNDEVWIWPPGRLAEAESRCGDYVKLGVSKILNLSQGGVPGEDFDTSWNLGTREELGAKCLGCGRKMQLKWAGKREDGSFFGMIWDTCKRPNGDWDVNKCVPTCRYTCEFCGFDHVYSSKTLDFWNKTCLYFPTNPDPEPNHRSFRWTGIMTYPWSDLVREYLMARNAYHVGVMEPLIIWNQKRMARSVDEASFHQERHFKSESIKLDGGKPMPGEKFRCIQVDRQRESLYWVSVFAVMDSGEAKMLWFGKLYSGADVAAKADEYGVMRNNVLFDSGFESKSDGGVYAICIDFGFIAVKGVGNRAKFNHVKKMGKKVFSVERSYAPVAWGDPELGKVGGGSRRRCPLIRFSSDIMADRADWMVQNNRVIVLDRFDTPELKQEFENQITAEVKVRVQDNNGRWKEVWKQLNGRENHAWDLLKILMLHLILAKVLKDIDVQADNPQ